MVVAAQPVNLTVELSGRTTAALVSEVRPQVGGVIKARYFREGSNVRAGQALYLIDPAPFQTTLNGAAAGLVQAQADAKAASLRANRYKALVAIDAISKQDNEDAEAAALRAAAAVDVQKAAVDQARINLAYTRVAAPISGRVGRSSVTPGALVTAQQPAPLAVVQDLKTIYVDATQSTASLLRLRRGLAGGNIRPPTSAAVDLTLEDGSTYPLKGRLEFSEVSADPATGTVTLRAVFPNPDGVLLPGMYVRARVSHGVAETGILAPQAAISRDDQGRATVFVVGAGDRAELRTLVLDQTVGESWLVSSGLKPGDRLIVQGLQRLRPGAVLKAAPVDAPQAARP